MLLCEVKFLALEAFYLLTSLYSHSFCECLQIALFFKERKMLRKREGNPPLRSLLRALAMFFK